MGQHDGLCLRAMAFNLTGVDIVSDRVDVDKHRYAAKLQDRVDGSGSLQPHR